MIELLLLALGLALLGFAAKQAQNRQISWGARATWLIVLLPPGLAAAASGALRLAAAQGTPPEPAQRTLFHGVKYQRSLQDAPRPLVVHKVELELGAQGLSFMVSPGEIGKMLPVAARPASEFLVNHRLELGITGGRFSPGYAATPWQAPLDPGAHVQPHGRTVARGVQYGSGDLPSTVYFTERGEVSIGSAPGGSVYNAITGDCVLLGKGADLAPCAFAEQAIARSALGLSEDGKQLILVVVDGARAGVSEGVSAAELAQLLPALGAAHAVQLGVGPQAALLALDDQGEMSLLSNPMGLGYSGSERRVGVVLGVHAQTRLLTP